ncbi:O-antigen ligase family protein [Ramlibacter sp. G-1-2-2]|uniref:O-antigen ligase family protein n=1 Tax=Ramlibacter agri TaxID=2728837 RepID=A0A848H8D4_9BURK|nr:O-antigen ligase family protein [Ramlibacter agri]
MSAVVPRYVSEEIASWNDRIAQAILSFGLATLGFFVLWSSAGTSIAMFFIVVACCLVPRRFVQLWPRRDRMVQIGLLLLAWIALRSFVGEGVNYASWRIVNHYHELLMLPVMWAVMRLAWRPQAFTNGLMLAGLIATAILFATALRAWYHLGGSYELQGHMEQAIVDRRISLGFGLSVCAFLIYEHARLGRLPRVPGYAGAALFAGAVLFACDARTGYVLVLALAGCAGYRAAPRKWRYQAVVALLVLGALLASTSQPLRTRFMDTVKVLQGAQPVNDSELSTTIRLEVLRNGLDVARDHWVLGTGWVAYQDAFRAIALARHPGQPELPGSQSVNPHNEYLLQLGAGGLPALLLFLAWLAWPMWRAARQRRLDRPWVGAAGCIAFAFAISALFNSVLLDFMEAHLYAALMGWMMARRLDRS